MGKPGFEPGSQAPKARRLTRLPHFPYACSYEVFKIVGSKIFLMIRENERATILDIQSNFKKLASRIDSYDFLRGIALLLMFLDHIAFLLGIRIEPFTIRFLTRLSEPLFAMLFGYFLINRVNKGKFFDSRLVAAALLSNLLFYTYTQRFDILVSFVLILPIATILKEKFVFLLPVVFLFSQDPTLYLLDYPISLVISQAAFGMLLRLGGNPLPSLIFLVSFLFFPQESVLKPYSYVSFFSFISAVIMILALEYKNIRLPIVNLLGKHALLFYVLQFYIPFILLILILLLDLPIDVPFLLF